jgi:hypothetical protein
LNRDITQDPLVPELDCIDKIGAKKELGVVFSSKRRGFRHEVESSSPMMRFVPGNRWGMVGNERQREKTNRQRRNSDGVGRKLISFVVGEGDGR